MATYVPRAVASWRDASHTSVSTCDLEAMGPCARPARRVTFPSIKERKRQTVQGAGWEVHGALVLLVRGCGVQGAGCRSEVETPVRSKRCRAQVAPCTLHLPP